MALTAMNLLKNIFSKGVEINMIFFRKIATGQLASISYLTAILIVNLFNDLLLFQSFHDI